MTTPTGWRKSSRSQVNNACVEVAPAWRKSSHSSDSGNCVEIADLPDTILVRDSKDPDGAVLAFDRDTWGRFVDAVKRNEI